MKKLTFLWFIFLAATVSRTKAETIYALYAVGFEVMCFAWIYGTNTKLVNCLPLSQVLIPPKMPPNKWVPVTDYPGASEGEENRESRSLRGDNSFGMGGF